jgi:hypothetical protein
LWLELPEREVPVEEPERAPLRELEQEPEQVQPRQEPEPKPELLQQEQVRLVRQEPEQAHF